MEDVITDIPPPSRFFQEDLNNFTPPSFSLPSPFLLFSNPKPELPLHPSLLIIAMSSPSLSVFHHVSTKTLIGSLILPEIPFSGNSVEPSLKDRSCNIYSINDANNFVLVVSIQCKVSADRSHAVAKLLLGEQIVAERVLICDSVQSRNFHGALSPDETFALKLETSLERRGAKDGCVSQSLLKKLDFFPSGTVIDGLAAALLGRCQVKKLRGTLCISWPEHGGCAAALMRSLLLKDVLPSLKISSGGEDECLKFSGTTDRHLDSDLYT